VAVPTDGLLTHSSAAPRSAPRERRTSRLAGRSLACVAVLVLASLTWLTSLAAATPTVTFKASAIPIPGVPGTGNILGAGTAVEVEATIAGTEYGGFPSPVTGINFYSPAGVGVNPAGFATCAPAALEAEGPTACPKRSIAGPVGIGFGVVAFGGERVPESVSIEEFFSPDHGLSFYVEGKTPSSFQILEKAHWIPTAAPFGKEVIVEVPLVETVPDGPDASVLSFKVKVGAAYMKGKKVVSYIRQPKKCPKGGFPVKMEMKFLSGEEVTTSYAVPCPKR
jgi:hypothetical protein